MSHTDVLVCDAGPSFSKYGRLKLCISISNILTNKTTEYRQLRPETGDVMDWM